MTLNLYLKKGIDLDLAGAVPGVMIPVRPDVSECAVIPEDFHGFVPKLDVKEGERVAQGQPIMHDKSHEDVKLVAPAAGIIKEVVRGERRKIERVVITIDGSDSVHFDIDEDMDKDRALSMLCRSGMFARMRQRPYDIVPDPDVRPRDIFITGMDYAPLATGFPNFQPIKSAALAAGVKLLSLLTDGKVYLSIGPEWIFGATPGAEIVEVEGYYPASNVGVQIANIKPVNKGETVWTLDAVTLNKIGELALTGKINTETRVALTGSEVKNAHMIAAVEGAQVTSLIEGQLAHPDAHVRIISGNVLTGTSISADGFMHFPYRQITIIPEGDDADEFMGWASLSPKKMSTHRSFISHFKGRRFKPDARMLGGRRAMIMSGEYDKVMPMDIMPEYLIKAILAKDIEQMEKLGIYEVAPEDFAAAEYVDTSKLPLQKIVRDGLDYMRKELS